MNFVSQILKLFVLVCSISCSYGKNIEMLVTSCQSVELEFHVTIFTIYFSEHLSKPINLTLDSEHPDIAQPLQKIVSFTPSESITPRVIFVYGKKVGSTYINVKFNSTEIADVTKQDRVHVLVIHSLTLKSICSVIGWIYFLAWSISFYPQVYVNFKRRSVIGLNFDFVCYNITGFIAYTFFNVGLFYVPSIQDEYFAKYGGSVIPVQPNDVFFSMHAVLLTLVLITQCFCYERGNQKISIACKILTAVAWLFALSALIPACLSEINWLTYLYYFSYIKLAVTLIKYIPQAYMNYKRKSTVGWSIGNVVLDFTGGSFSILQMFLISYNNDQWSSIFGDFTKFALGLFSVLFDIFFMLQHYVFYRQHPDYEPIEDRNEETQSPTNTATVA